MEKPIKYVRDFLTLNLIPGKRLLLALSGGGDSLALLYLLIECREKLDFELHIAHVDHAWREESEREAALLDRLAKHLKLPFHQKRLSPVIGSNLEDRYREKRYTYFQELQEKWGFQAVLLGHHADDQGETVLKRICEGARLGGLGGLKAKTERGNLTLWRPLLPIRKAELLIYLNRKKLEPFDDWTNFDLRYLRPRMRQKIFPELEKQFGKGIGRNFHRLGLLFQEIAQYLDEKKEEIMQKLVQGPFGAYLEHPSKYPVLEMRYFLEEMARASHAHLSQDSCEILLRLIAINAPKAEIWAGPLTYILNKDYLFLLKKEIPPFDGSLWKDKGEPSNWKDFWKGSCLTTPNHCQMKLLDELTPVLRKKMKKWYAKHQVPPFLHDKAPIFVIGSQIVGECLTGRSVNIT
jgi:tRNA(Ile)-lysidine synthase